MDYLIDLKAIVNQIAEESDAAVEIIWNRFVDVLEKLDKIEQDTPESNHLRHAASNFLKAYEVYKEAKSNENKNNYKTAAQARHQLQLSLASGESITLSYSQLYMGKNNIIERYEKENIRMTRKELYRYQHELQTALDDMINAKRKLILTINDTKMEMPIISEVDDATKVLFKRQYGKYVNLKKARLPTSQEAQQLLEAGELKDVQLEQEAEKAYEQLKSAHNEILRRFRASKKRVKKGAPHIWLEEDANGNPVRPIYYVNSESFLSEPFSRLALLLKYSKNRETYIHAYNNMSQLQLMQLYMKNALKADNTPGALWEDVSVIGDNNTIYQGIVKNAAGADLPGVQPFVYLATRLLSGNKYIDNVSLYNILTYGSAKRTSHGKSPVGIVENEQEIKDIIAKEYKKVIKQSF